MFSVDSDSGHKWLVNRRYLGHIVNATSVALYCLDGDSSSARMRFVCGRSKAGRGPAVPPERVPDRNTNAVRSTRLSYSSRFRHQRVSVTNYSNCPPSWNQTNRLILDKSRCVLWENQFYGDEQETLVRAQYFLSLRRVSRHAILSARWFQRYLLMKHFCQLLYYGE